MTRFYLFIIAVLLLPLHSQAQTADTASFTLEQCIQYALENSVAIKNAVLDQEIARAKVKETRGIGLPQLNGNVTLQHNPKLQQFFSTYEVAQGFRGNAPKLTDVSLQDVVSQANFFQLQSNGTAALSVNQLLFNSSYLVGLKAANTYKELSVRTAQQTNEQIVQNVAKAYYACLINKDRIKLFDNNIARIDSLLKSTRALNENGFAERIDVDRIQVTYNNLKVERDKFYNLQDLSINVLKFQMNYPMSDSLRVIGDISSLNINGDILKNYSDEWDYANRIDYKILETNRELQKLNVKNNYAESLPSLSAFATLGYFTQSRDVAGLFKTNTPRIVETQGYTRDKWFPYSSYGVTLNVPLFSGLQRNYKLQQAKLTLQKVENSFSALKSGIDLEIAQSNTTFINANESLKSQKENVALAQNIARITKIKYEQGVGSNLEVVDAETALKEAQTNYYSALYDAIIAKVDLDKAYGKLLPTITENK